MVSFDDETVPDLGTVAQAFSTLDQLIEGLDDYAKPLWRQASDRLQTARTRLNQPAPPTTGRNKFMEALKKLETQLTPFSTLILAGRVIQHRQLLKNLREIHQILDRLFRDLEIQESDAWGPALTLAGEHYAAALQERVESPAETAELARDGPLYCETVTLLKCAADSGDSEQWNPLAIQLHQIVSRMVVEHDAPTDTQVRVPVWFVPPMNVTYHRKPFATGSFGAVHHGTWGSGAKVVVKVLLDSERLGYSLQQAFLEEANNWYRFTHPNCVRMFGASHLSSPPFILCEDATNGNLADYLARNDGPDEHNRDTQVWRRLHEALLGLEYLHGKGVLHRDLKLNNMLVGKDGYTRIGDFGMSGLKDQSRSKSNAPVQPTTEKAQVGAIRWRAPECFRERPSEASDVYSFGMCIYEALTGEVPFGYLDDDFARQRIEEGALPDRPRTFTDDDAWGLIVAMTKKNPTDRISLKDAIAKVHARAQQEGAVERSKFVLCVQCQTRLLKGSKFCHQCAMEVGTKSVDEEIIRIGSSKDLARIVNLLTIGTDVQKKGGLKALLDYMFGDPRRQQKVHDAGAIPVLVKMLNDLMVNSPQDDLLVDALLVLGSLYAVNEPIQDTAAYEGALAVLEKALAETPHGGDDRRRAKATMAIGLLADSHAHNRQLVLARDDVVATIRTFAAGDSDVLKKAATGALHHLGLTARAA